LLFTFLWLPLCKCSSGWNTIAISLLIRSIIATLVFLCCPVITMTIWCKIRNYDSLKDKFLFFFEVKASGIMWILSVVLTIVIAIIDSRLTEHTFVIPYLFCFCAICPSLLSTVVIPLKIKHAIKKNGVEAVANEINESAFDLERQVGREYTVRDMFQDEQLFELFIAWMMREFSSECPLLFIECVQFKQYIIKVQSNELTVVAAQTTDTANISEKTDVKYINYCYDGVAISSIVSRQRLGMNEMEKCCDMAHELWLKYVKVGATFENNICYDLREKYAKCDANNWNMSLDELLMIFDGVMVIANRFMIHSLSRFKEEMRSQSPSS